VAQEARDAGIALRHQLLLYPVTDCRMGSPSYAEFSDGYYLTRAIMGWFFAQYLPDARAAADCRASPLLQENLRGLAPATIITAEYDPLRDEGEAYADALKKAGVPVTLRRWNGQIHGFMSMLGVIAAADEALSFAAGALRDSAPPLAKARA
jgi:acetyl esterase